ncbi:hypothetical protein PN4B1_19810 [Paenibacillus naphthalenovorans]|nr:hypothetical protein PN4B1_19810 [Paenibacillus naphthalenovorans]
MVASDIGEWDAGSRAVPGFFSFLPGRSRVLAMCESGPCEIKKGLNILENYAIL